ncbi:methyl-accepting chemotaxis protein [Rhodoblastus acidophilus]|uniref:methyl-accepting chemotaxis protein n=1 Tax=Rhodoblastus acidophilus TaxID=1074 RepID=UPI0022242F73|nr:methyl-accepting chemotaxis protein [Rhodoblastus acidophilus]MCW2283286.1 methyl-accepting chemotaxis protein [Rhodoblastus acidophilus]MCW2332146.1 methyl-accepting chemotaxis protein [Rhodoblastus acidophilus]
MPSFSRLRAAGKASSVGNLGAASLERVAARLIPQLGAVVEAYHEKFATDPELALLTRGDAAALKQAQVERWRDLLTAQGGEAYAARARRIGEAHAKAGVSARFYLQSYLFFFEALVERAAGESSATLSALARALFADMELALAAFVENAEDQMVEQSAQHMVKSVEEEVRVAHHTAKSRAGDLTEIVGELSRSVEELRRGFEMMEGNSRSNRDEIKSVASAIEDVQGSSREVGDQAEETSRRASEAVAVSEEAARRMARLTETANRVAEIVRLIGAISAQTNLLALNAAIEASRAGEAGRGFAVVAAEVKQLSQRTAVAAKDISEQIAEIVTATDATSAALARVGEMIGDMDGMARGVASHAAHQVAQLDEIAVNARTAATNANDLSRSARMFTAGVIEIEAIAGNVQDFGAKVAGLLRGLTNRLTITVRGFLGVDTRRHPRVPVKLRVSVECGGLRRDVSTLEISEGGCSLWIAGHGLDEDSDAILDIPGLGATQGKTRGRDPDVLHIEFVALSNAQREALAALVARAIETDAPLRALAARRRDQVRDAMEQAVARGEISLEDLFSTEYVPLPGANPEQVATPSLELLERILPPILEGGLAEEPRLAFCIATDRNGYVPVHNKKWSQPQGDDPVWNARHARNRRIFDDRAGLAAARNLQEALVQSYPRDLGDGAIEMMKDISMPIAIRGQHWGALRIAIPLDA